MASQISSGHVRSPFGQSQNFDKRSRDCRTRYSERNFENAAGTEDLLKILKE